MIDLGGLPFGGLCEGNPKEWGEEPRRRKWRLPLNCSAKSFVRQLTPEGRRVCGVGGDGFCIVVGLMGQRHSSATVS